MNSGNIIKKPIITNKSTTLQKNGNKYTFIVDRNASKNQIKHTLETLFNVQIINVRTLNYAGKKIRNNRYMHSNKHYYKSDWKKAIITLKSQQKIYMINDESTENK
jgi:large subunit ribosomal protein L23